jgi:hypothetical protein
MIGQILGHYEVLAKLGAGGMGVVYKAKDTRLERFVALKVLRADLAANAERTGRFIQEAKAASALNHPNIVTIHDIVSANGTDVIVMEYVEGTRWPVAGRLARRPRYGRERTVPPAGRSGRGTDPDRRISRSLPGTCRRARRQRGRLCALPEQHQLRHLDAGARNRPGGAGRRQAGHALLRGRHKPRVDTRWGNHSSCASR